MSSGDVAIIVIVVIVVGTLLGLWVGGAIEVIRKRMK